MQSTTWWTHWLLTLWFATSSKSKTVTTQTYWLTKTMAALFTLISDSSSLRDSWTSKQLLSKLLAISSDCSEDLKAKDSKDLENAWWKDTWHCTKTTRSYWFWLRCLPRARQTCPALSVARNRPLLSCARGSLLLDPMCVWTRLSALTRSTRSSETLTGPGPHMSTTSTSTAAREYSDCRERSKSSY